MQTTLDQGFKFVVVTESSQKWCFTIEEAQKYQENLDENSMVFRIEYHRVILKSKTLEETYQDCKIKR